MEKSTSKTKEKLLKEIEELRTRISDFESSSTKDQSTTSRSKSFWSKRNRKKSGVEQVSDETFRLIAKNTSDGISLHSFTLKVPYTYVSPAMELLSGYDSSYLLGKSPFDFVHPDDKKELYSMLKDYVSKKITKLYKRTESAPFENIEFRFKHKSGDWRYFQSTANISGKQLLFVTRDVTEQKQIQKALLQSENKYRKLFEQSADAILIIGGDKFVDCNAATVSMLRYKNRQELLDTHPSQLSPEFQPDGRLSFQKANEMMSIAYENGSHRFEWDHKKADGEVFPVEVLLTSIPLGEEKFLHVVWRDITDRKEAELELKQSEHRFKRLFEDLGDAVYVTKIGGTNKGRILEVNSAAIKQTGYTRKELLKMNIIGDFYIRGSGEINTDEWEEKLLKGELVTTVEKKRRKDGTEYWTEVIVTPIEFKGEKASLSINHDITKRKYAEDALRSIATQFSSLSGLEFIEKVCYHLTETLQIDYAFVGTILTSQNTVSVLAGIGKGEPIKPFEYELADTPCENVIGQSICSYPSGVQSLFPKDLLLVEMNIDSYFGIPLFNRSGDAMGIIVLLHSQPMDNVEVATSLLQIFSDRVAAEMERMDAEEALQDSEERLSRLSGASFEGIAVHEKGRIVDANQTLAKLFGYELSEIIGMNAMDLTAPESRDLVMQNIVSGYEQPYEGLGLKKDGTTFYVELVGKPLPYKGRVVRVTAIRDITERKKMQIALIESEHLLRESQKVAAVGSYVLDITTGIWQSSTTLDSVFGIDKNFKRNIESWVQFLYEDDREMMQNYFATNVLTNHESFNKEYRIKRINDQKVIWVHGFGELEFNEDGNPIKMIGTIQDITERKIAEDVIRESEEKYRELIEGTKNLITRVDIQGNFTFVNQISHEFFGLSPEECIGISAFDFVYEDDKQKTLEWFDAMIKSKETNGTIENRQINKKTGEVHNLLWTCNLQYNDDGNATGMSAIAKDVTEFKHAQEALTQERQRLAYILDGTNVGTWDWNIQTGELTLNNRWAEIMGFTLEELGPVDINTWINNVHPDDLPVANALLERHFSGELDYYGTEFRQPHKDGRWIWVNARGKVTVWSADGKPLRMSGTHLDITDRKRAEQIQKVLFNISTAVNTSQNLKTLLGIVREELGNIIDTTNFYVAFYNDETDLFSLPFMVDEKDTFTSFPGGKSLTKYILKINKPLLVNKKRLKELEKSDDVKSYGTESEIWLGVPFKIEGKINGVIAVHSYSDEKEYNESDMKILEFIADQLSSSIDRKKSEENLIIALEKATESDRLKSAFLATMSHELRTPLNAIIGFTNLINEEMPFDEVINYNNIVNSSGNHLLTIVEDLFDITLIEAGEIKLHNQEEDIHTILDEVHDIIKGEQQITKKQHLDLNLLIPSKKSNLIVNIDSAKLKQILINLLKNALKFTPSGHVHFGYEIEKDKDEPVIKFFVKDTGIGISKEKQEFIFDVFRQVEDSHTRIYGGTGIGLSIAKKLTNLLGGSIWLESDIATQDKKGGTTFYFTIPFEEIELTDRPTRKEVIQDLQRKDDNREKTILIVEDDKDSFEFLRIVLKTAKMNTLWAQDGSTAIKYCREKSDIDLVLMDINMPVMNGYQATKEIKKLKPKLPIIAQTAYAIAGDKEKALEEGCDDYISKPIKRDELMSKIDGLLSG